MIVTTTFASDHNNLDSGRPLSFDDAKTLAYGERAIEFGTGWNLREGRRPHLSLMTEFKYGIAMNAEIGVGLATHEDYAHISYLRQLRRETDAGPAQAFKIELAFPGTAEGSGVQMHLRWIASRMVGAYDTIHLNLDMEVDSIHRSGESNMRFGATLGYQRPLGAPTQFHRTLVGEIGLEPLPRSGWTPVYGVGMRELISPREVVDFGIQARNIRGFGATITAGYSLSF